MFSLIKNNWLKIIISLSCLLITLSVIYYYILYLPNLAKKKIDLENSLAEARKICAVEAEKNSIQHDNNRFMPDVIDYDKYDNYYKNCLRSKGFEKE